MHGDGRAVRAKAHPIPVAGDDAAANIIRLKNKTVSNPFLYAMKGKTVWKKSSIINFI